MARRKLFISLPKKAKKFAITDHSFIEASSEVEKEEDFLGVVSGLLCTAFCFSRKTKQKPSIEVYLKEGMKDANYIIKLAESKNRSKEWANGRGDVEGTPKYFEQEAFNFSQKHPSVKVKIINGDGLVNDGFRLLHAVGRASKNTPAFVNLAYNGNPESDKWIAFVGKGVCFDTGGLNIKPASGMRLMFLDKHGACSVLSAFETIVEEGLKANVTCSIGLVENSIN